MKGRGYELRIRQYRSDGEVIEIVAFSGASIGYATRRAALYRQIAARDGYWWDVWVTPA